MDGGDEIKEGQHGEISPPGVELDGLKGRSGGSWNMKGREGKLMMTMASPRENPHNPRAALDLLPQKS